MTLIERLVSYDAAGSVAVADVSERSVFFARTGVPAWTGIEYMSQTIAAHAGFEARLRGAPPAVGFVLGTRAYASLVDEFPMGSRLTIRVAPEHLDAAFGAFKCSIETDRIVATAVVNTYRPPADEIAKIRQRMRGS